MAAQFSRWLAGCLNPLHLALAMIADHDQQQTPQPPGSSGGGKLDTSRTQHGDWYIYNSTNDVCGLSPGTQGVVNVSPKPTWGDCMGAATKAGKQVGERSLRCICVLSRTTLILLSLSTHLICHSILPFGRCRFLDGGQRLIQGGRPAVSSQTSGTHPARAAEAIYPSCRPTMSQGSNQNQVSPRPPPSAVVQQLLM